LCYHGNVSHRLKAPTLKAMHKALHAPNFLWKWLSVLIRRSVYPVIEERLVHILVQGL
jgi:hypothetical protein